MILRGFLLGVMLILIAGVSTHASLAQESEDGERILAAAREHNALLERLDTLEPSYLEDRSDATTLRHLVRTYVALLGFEQGTDFGSNVFLLASRRLDEFAEVSGGDDAEFVARMRAMLFFHLRTYPMTLAELKDAGQSPDTIVLRHLLAELGQDEFREADVIRHGDLTVRVFESTALQPEAEGLLWPVVHFVVAPSEGASPHRTSSFSLMRRGGESDGRYYLYFNNLNRSGLVALYGVGLPNPAVVRNEVARALQTFTAPR